MIAKSGVNEDRHSEVGGSRLMSRSSSRLIGHLYPNRNPKWSRTRSMLLGLVLMSIAKRKSFGSQSGPGTYNLVKIHKHNHVDV